jgi:hypothetical protein
VQAQGNVNIDRPGSSGLHGGMNPQKKPRNKPMPSAPRSPSNGSDPASVALGVAGACSGQYAQLSNQMQGGMITEKGQAYMRDQMRTNELRLATTAVLTYRASKREQQN